MGLKSKDTASLHGPGNEAMARAWTLELSAEVKGQNVGDESSAHHATFRALI